jgi:ABC-type multidrug transport system permease subunit
MIDIAVLYQNQFGLLLLRERNDVYSWKSLVTSILLVEAPVNMICSVLSFVCFF